MRKADALRLKPGDFVVFGDHGRVAKWTWKGCGRVERVTPGGGVLVTIIEGVADGKTWEGRGTGAGVGERRWVPYSYISHSLSNWS
jgi:hypothetical protein